MYRWCDDGDDYDDDDDINNNNNNSVILIYIGSDIIQGALLCLWQKL